MCLPLGPREELKKVMYLSVTRLIRGTVAQEWEWLGESMIADITACGIPL